MRRWAALTAQTTVPGCATGRDQCGRRRRGHAFLHRGRQVCSQGALKFYDEAEWATLQQRYGSLAHLQTVGNAPD